LEKIYTSEEQRERALKALRLNGDSSPDYDPKLLAGSSITTRKPTVWIKKRSITGGQLKLRDASSIQGMRLKEAPSIQGQLLKGKRAAECLGHSTAFSGGNFGFIVQSGGIGPVSGHSGGTGPSSPSPSSSPSLAITCSFSSTVPCSSDS
jgi:hypothetical protein